MSHLVAEFASEIGLKDALRRLRSARVGELRTYTPMALSGEAENSPLPLIIFVAGMIGFAAGFAMEVYANAVSYPLDIGGRPEFSWPAFVPIAFEIGVLFAMLGGVLGYFVVNRMPRFYERIDECDFMRRATRDRWILSIRSDDQSKLARAREVLDLLHPTTIEELLQ